MIAARRGKARPHDWTNGPARLCQALDIDGKLNGVDLTDPRSAPGYRTRPACASTRMISGPRVGINKVPEPWRSMPWRFRVDLQTWNLPTQ